MGAVSQLHPPACRWLVFGVEEKEKWERGGWIYLRRRKGNFTLVSLHDRCPPARPVICPSRVVPLFSEAAVTDHLLSFSAFPLMVPPVVHMRKLKPWTDTVGFVESRQACDEAASRYQQDPGRLIGASDTDPGKETKRWPLRAPSVSTLPCLTWTRLMGWTSWIRCVFFFFLLSQRKSNRSLCCLSLSLCGSSSLLSLPPPPCSPPPPPLSLRFQQRPEWFGETKAPLVLFDLSIMASMNPDGVMTTLRLEKHRTESAEIRGRGIYVFDCVHSFVAWWAHSPHFSLSYCLLSYWFSPFIKIRIHQAQCQFRIKLAIVNK